MDYDRKETILFTGMFAGGLLAGTFALITIVLTGLFYFDKYVFGITDPRTFLGIQINASISICLAIICILSFYGMERLYNTK